jgi:nitroreductase
MSEEPGLFEILYTCRAMRRLKSDPVPRELLLKLIDAANQAPSGSNLQRARWIIVQDQAQKAKLAELNRKAVEAYTLAQASQRTELPHYSAEKRQRNLNAGVWLKEHMHEAPALIVACYEFPAAVTDTARGAGSVWPGVQNLLLAARALGLGATPTTLGLMDRAAVVAALGLPDTVATFCLIPVGWPMGNFGPVTRLPVEETVRWDRW